MESVRVTIRDHYAEMGEYWVSRVPSSGEMIEINPRDTRRVTEVTHFTYGNDSPDPNRLAARVTIEDLLRP